ncbi:MAG: YHS domain-containing protein [Nitrospirae bacterium]|nr:YHS domain-containing protein [Nitrospirota bacterium]
MPGDRIALWAVIKPPTVDPVCKMPHQENFIRHTHNGKDYFFCSEGCLSEFQNSPGKYKDDRYVEGKYKLVFYDTKTDKSVLSVPVIFAAKGEASHAGQHQH